MRSTSRRRTACQFRRYAIDSLEPRLLLAADVVGTAFSVVPTSVGLSHTVTVNYTVSNKNLIPGLDYADIFFVDFYLSRNSSISTSDIYLDTHIVLILLAGESKSYVVTLDLAGDEGAGPNTTDPFHDDNQYYLGMILNPGNQIVESDYSNNSNEGDGLDRAPISSEVHLPSPTIGTSVVSSSLTLGTAATGDIWHRNDGGGGEYIGPYDVDTFRFTAAANQTVAFDLDVEPFSNTSRLDSYMKLYNSSFIELDQNDNGAAPGEVPGKDSYFGHTFSSAGTYYLVISDNNSAAADPRVMSGRAAGGFGAYTINTLITSATPGTPDLRASSDTGTSSTDGVTRDATPTFDITAAGPGTVRLYHNGNLLGQTTNASSSSYAVTLSPAVGDGQYDVYATYTAATAGSVESPLSAAASHLSIDTVAPTVSAPVLDAASDTGIDPLQKYTKDGTPTLVGSVEAAATVEVLLDSVSVSPVTRNGAPFSYTPATSLSEGTHSATTRATDVAGNQATSLPKSFTVDTIAPAAPALPDLIAASDTGSSDSDNITSSPVPTFVVGTVPAGHRVQLLFGTVEIASVTATSAGPYTLTPPSQPDGTYVVRTTFQDLAGNLSPTSSSVNLRIDTIKPTITFAGFRYQLGPQAALVTFSEVVETPTAASIDMIDVGTGLAVHPTESIATSSFTQVELNIDDGSGVGLFKDGTFRLVIGTSQFPDAAGNMLDAGVTLQFFALGGDANRDHHVNLLDFNTLASDYGRTAQAFGQGDFNLDRTVNSLDFARLATKFNTSLPILPGSLPEAAEGSGSSGFFAHDRIDGEGNLLREDAGVLQ